MNQCVDGYHRFARLKPAFAAHEQQWWFAVLLEMCHVRPMQINFRGAPWRVDLEHRQISVAGVRYDRLRVHNK